MADAFSDISYFAHTNARAKYTRFGIKQADRLSHTYIVGATGTGKSTLLETFARQDIDAGRGLALIDPHGDLVERVAEYARAANRPIVYLDAPNAAQPYGYNPLRRVRDDKIPLAASGLIETLRKLWPDAWGVRMEHVLRNAVYALLERNGSVLPDILRLFTDDDYRTGVVPAIHNETVRHFWTDEFENYPARLRAEAVAPIQNKLGALLSDPMLHRVLVAPKVDVRFRALMDDGGIFLANLAKGRIGEDSATTLGGLLVCTIGLAALSRAEAAPTERCPFFLYADEFQTFTTLAFVNMMAELRKYGLGLVLAHQYLHQLEPGIRHAVFGNAATVISLRVGAEDAGLLAREFQPTFAGQDLISLPNQHIYLKLMIDGAPSRPFSGRSSNT